MATKEGLLKLIKENSNPITEARKKKQEQKVKSNSIVSIAEQLQKVKSNSNASVPETETAPSVSKKNNSKLDYSGVTNYTTAIDFLKRNNLNNLANSLVNEKDYENLPESAKVGYRDYQDYLDKTIEKNMMMFNISKDQEKRDAYKYENLSSNQDFDEYKEKGKVRAGVFPGEGETFDVNKHGNKVERARDGVDLSLKYGVEQYGGEMYNFKELTNREVDNYNYLLAKEGYNSAEKYLRDLKAGVTERIGTKVADIIDRRSPFTKTALTAGMSAGRGLNQAATSYASLPAYISATKDVAEINALDVAGEKVRDNIDSGFGRLLYDAGTNISAQLPSFVVGGITGSATAQAITMGMQSSGGDYREQILAGKDPKKARIHATGIGTLEAGLGRALNAAGGAVGWGPAKLSSKANLITNSFARGAANLGISLGSEILEEEGQLFLAPVMDMLVYGDKWKTPEVDEIVNTALVTMISTGVMSGGGVISSITGDNSALGKEVLKQFNVETEQDKSTFVNALIDEGNSHKRGSDSYNMAKTLQRKVNKGVEISEHQIGTMYAAIVRDAEIESAKKLKRKSKIPGSAVAGLAKGLIDYTISEMPKNSQAYQYAVELKQKTGKITNEEFNYLVELGAVQKQSESFSVISVGDTFKDTKTGNTITVVERDTENTTVEIDTGAKTETREFTNNQADNLATNEQFEQVESSETLSPEDAQKYNIVVSNLKRKAEELGLLDNNFFTALQNVNLYNPSANDRGLISSEFHRVFAGNTDPLVAGWLDAIGVGEKSAIGKNIHDKNVLKNSLDSDTIISTENIEESAGDINGIKQSGESLKYDEQRSKVQAEKSIEGVQDRNSDLLYQESGERNDRGGNRYIQEGTGESETRKLEEIIENDNFVRLSQKIGNSISGDKYKVLYEQNKNDPRLDEGYEFIDIITYDMLTDENNELRTQFADEMAEYFNENTSPDVDSTGAKLTPKIIERLRESVVRNDRGQLIPVYHGTLKQFTRLISGDIGIHFGSLSQAIERIKNKQIDNPVYIKAYLDIKSPLYIDEDFEGWHAKQISQKLYKMGILTDEESAYFYKQNEENARKLDGELVKILQDKGYDGIVYKNDHESGYADSYIVFDDSQIYRASEKTADAEIQKAAVGSQVPYDSNTTPQLQTSETPLNSSSASDNNVSQESDVVNSSVRTDKENDTMALTDKCELIATKHTETGNDIWVVTLKDRLSSEEYKDLNRKVKSVGGYYSRFTKTLDGKAIPGFVFKSEPTANEIKVFNDFFRYTDETVSTNTQPADVNEKVYELVKKARNAEPVDPKSLEKIRDYYGYDLYIEALDRVVSENQADELMGKAKELKSLMEENGTTNDVLNNEPESDTIVSERTKEDFQVGDILEFDGEQWKCVNIDSMMIDFENVDKNAFQPKLSVILPYELFKEKTDYTVIKESAENVESQSEVLDREIESDDRGLHAGAENKTQQDGVESIDGTHREDSGKGLSESVRTDGNRPDDRNGSEGVYGTDDADNAESEVRGNAAEITDSEPETIDTEVKTIEKKRPSNKGNFVITDDIATEFDNTAPSAKDNIEAIELLIKLENEGRPATAEEKKILAKYKGWGGIDTRYIPYELSSRFGQLFDWEQRKAMQSSQNNAFFTPTGVIDAMYNGLKRMGFKGGNVLETSMGIGNFFGRMPSAISAKSALTGVELESYTARIAQYLYPGATVINMPYQDVAIKNGSYDLVIGNVPFGQNKISYNKKKYALHNYFIISSLDKVRDGGIVAVITSAGTLESHSLDARAAIMDRADVVACYKLPEKVFSRNASTDVQTDLLILRKRAAGTKPSGDSILNTTTTADGLHINEYFVKHPENVLGTLAKGHNAWGEITTVLDNGDFYDRLNAAMKKLPKDLISGKIDLKPVETIVSVSDKPRFFEKNGKVYADDGAGVATEVSKNQANTVRDYMAVRDAYKELLNAYENGETVIAEDGTASIREHTEDDFKALRDKLSKAYDNFYKKHGAITGDGKKKIGTKKSTNNTFLEADADYYLVSGLERYDAKNSTFVKSALFEKDTLRKKRVTSVDAASDALAVSLNESGKIDFARMQELTGKAEKQLAEELKGEIVLTPDGEYVLTDIYLSGNIYEKLDAVKGKPEFKAQQEMLEKVIPTPKDASDITVKLGANYIDAKYIEQFAREILNSHLTIRKDVSGRWVIEGVKQSRYGDVVNVKYGCNAFNAVQLLEKILNDGEITATKKVGTGRDATTVFDPEMTDIARQKADDIRAAFETWIFASTDRRTEIVDNYNRTYNNYRPLDYEHIAEKLSFDSMDDVLKSKLYPHQKKGIARFLFGGNILFAHGVGTGKTFEMIASVMEAKRMGIINKAAMVVPNNKVVDFKNDIAQAYPNAKVLVIDTANKKRQTMLGLVNSNDWDIVLIARTTFTRIPVSRELQAHFVSQQLEDLELQIAEAEYDRSVSKRQLKGMITQRDNFEQKLKDLSSDTKRDDDGIEFEKLGIDCICVDEAHNYKSIMTPTKLDIKGLVNRNNAQMANDMLMKLDYLRSIDGKIIFGTGTPITNTVSEIYNMMRMVRPDILEDAGIHSLDEWVNTFAKIETTTEIGIDNQIKNKSTQVIRSFINVSEMIGMFRQFADIVFTEDVVKNLPKAVYKDVELDGTEEHRQIEQQISSVISTAKKADLLKVYGQLMSMADVASVDLRMLAGAESEYNPFKDYSLDELEYADSKINTMCDNVYEEYKASEKIKGTQIIFCDKGSGSGTVYSFNLHKDIMQKLIERGIPQDQIVIIKNQSDAQLEALYEKVNAGEVRVLIGTSQKMAEGLNVQKRVVAIHHPTVTYKPSDKEQGDARGVRAGNINDEVHIYRYLQKNTFDSHKWQAQDRKGEMINKALRGEVVSEMEDIGADEDSGAGVDAATAMAITSGNPLVKEKIDIDKEVVRLKTLQRNYLSEMYRYQDAISKNPAKISQLARYADNIEQDIALRNKYGEKAAIVIKGKTFEKQTDANKALVDAVKSAPKNGQYVKLGTYNGFDIMFKGDTGGMNYSLILKGSNEYRVEYAGSGNNIARFAGVLNRLDAELKRVRETVETLKADLDFAKKEVTKPFEKEKELSEALEKQKDITYRYEHFSEKTASAETEETVQSSKDLSAADDESRWTTDRVEGNKGKGVNLADIVRNISKKFDIPIATGKVTDREASGIYKRKAETIRTRIANNLPTISHELGHHIDKKYDFSNLESVELLKSSLPEEFLEQYEEADRGREAVAEFVRAYLKNTNDANRLCPEFYADFISTLSKEDLKSLNEIAASVNEYLSYDISERYDAAITTSKHKEKLSFKEKWQRLYTSWVDAFHPQKEAVDFVEEVTGHTLSGKGNAYVLATNSLNAHTIANYLICEGFRDLDGNIVDAKSFVESIGMVDSKNVALLDKYLVLRHSLEWIEPTESDVAPKRVFADDTLENVEEIKKQIAKIEAEHPEIKTAAENLYEYQNNVIRHFVIPAGGMSEDTLNMLNRKYPSYVPFYRAVGNKKSGMAKGTFVNQRSPIMRAKGSGALILSPTESIIRNTEKMVKLALRNQTARVLSSYADTVDGFGQFMEAIPPDMIPHSVNIIKSKESFTDALQQVVSSGKDYFAVSDLFEQIFGDEVTDFTPVANANKKIITVLQDGKPTYYQIHDEALYNAVAELAPQQANGYIKWATKIMQPMKLLITQNNPIFAMTNAIRDFGTAYKLSEENNLAVFAAQYIKALGGIVTNNADYKRYKAMGGGHSSELSANVDNIARTLRTVAHKDMGKARRLAYSLFVHPVETVAMFNDAIESVPRFAEFQRTLKKGGDLQEAIFNASDITTNFKRSGSGFGVKIANSTFMFNNAAIQGLDKTFRTITNKDTKKRYGTLLKWLLHALLMGIIGYIYNKEVDEEGYKNLSSYKKNNFYNFAIGDGNFISLPKPRENALLDTLTERVLEYTFGNENAFYDFGTYLGGQLIPPMIPDDFKSIEDVAHSWLSGTVLGGVVDIGFNQDFKDAPIEGKYDDYLPSNERYNESTTKLAYALGQTKLARNMDMSPKKIDHLLSSYTGILGQANKALFPMNEERIDTSIGLRNKFISDSNYSTDVLNRMYENQEKAEKTFQYSGTIDTAIEYEKNSIITSYISGMNKAVKALPKDEQRNGRIYLLKSLNNWNYKNTASQTNMLSSLDGSTISTDIIFDELPSSTLEWTVDKQKYTYQMTPQEYHKYISDYLTVIENARKLYGCNSIESCEMAKEAAKEYMSEYKKTVLKGQYSSKAVAERK